MINNLNPIEISSSSQSSSSSSTSQQHSIDHTNTSNSDSNSSSPSTSQSSVISAGDSSSTNGSTNSSFHELNSNISSRPSPSFLKSKLAAVTSNITAAKLPTGFQFNSVTPPTSASTSLPSTALFEFTRPLLFPKPTAASVKERISFDSESTSPSSSPLFTFESPRNLPGHESALKQCHKETVSHINSSKNKSFNLLSNLGRIREIATEVAISQSEQVKQPQRNHVVVVEQAPFSVYKSIKYQEQIEKSNSNLIVVNSLRNHPYNNSIRPTILKNNVNSNNYALPQFQQPSTPLQPSQSYQNSSDNIPPSTIHQSSTLDSKPSQQPFSFPNPSGASCFLQPNSLLPISNELSSTSTVATAAAAAAKITTKTNSSGMNRNCSSNAILAQLKSLGPDFKSIFVRPKNSKHIDSSQILNKNKTGSEIAFDESNRSILSMLYSNSNGTINNNSKISSHANSSHMMKILPNIEPKELRLNQSVDELLKKFATENDALSRTIKSMSAASSSRASMSPASTRSSSPVFFQHKQTQQQKQQQQHQAIMNFTSKSATAVASSSSRDLQSSKNTATVSGRLDKATDQSKWTCMVCLSRHMRSIEVCAICGSSKPAQQESAVVSANISPGSASASSTTASSCSNTITFAKHYTTQNASCSSAASFSAYLLDELGFRNKLRDDMTGELNGNLSPGSSSHQQSDLGDGVNRTSSNGVFAATATAATATAANPYVKKWTCVHCNFSNDSLKIVCLNCRWVKTHPGASTSKSTMRLLDETVKSYIVNDATSPSKKGKSEDSSLHICTSCQSPIREESSSSTSTSTSTSISTSTSPIESASTKNPPPPPSTATATTTTTTTSTTATISTTQSLSDLFSSKTREKKWPCSTCLASNAESSEKCACCSEPRPKPPPTHLTTSQSASVGFFATSSVLQAKTWSCPTCLVSNADNLAKCPCCSEAKPGNGSLAKSQTMPLTSLASSSGKWTCDTCLVSNDADKANCVCCSTDRPGSSSANKPSELASHPTLILPSVNTSFKFGAVSSTAASDTAFKFDSGSASFSSSSSSINFGALTGNKETTGSGFSFGKPLSIEASSSSALTSTTSSKPTFTFGSHQNADSSAGQGFKLPVPKATETTTTTTTTKLEQPAAPVAFSFKPLVTDAPAADLTPPQKPFQFGSLITSSKQVAAASNAPTPSLAVTSTPLSLPSFGGISSSSSSSTNATAATNPTAPQLKPFILFGSSSATAATAATTPTPTPTKNADSATSTSLFGNTSSSSLSVNQQQPLFKFGQTPSAPTAASTSGGLSNFFGTLKPAPTDLSSSSTNTTPLASGGQTTTSLFGNTSATSSATSLAGGTSLFNINSSSSTAGGSQTSTATNSFSSLFGNNKPSTLPTFSFQSPSNTVSSLNTTASNSTTLTPSLQTSFFGTPTQQPQQQNVNSSSTTTSSFFNTNSISASSNNINRNSATTSNQFSSLFGNVNVSSVAGAASAATGPGLFQFNALSATPPNSSSSSLLLNLTRSHDGMGSENDSKAKRSNNAVGLFGNAPVSEGFHFNMTPEINFNFGASTPTFGAQQNGIIQFSGNSDQHQQSAIEGRRFRKAKRNHR